MSERCWEEFPVGPVGMRSGTGLRVTLSPKGEFMVGAKAFEKMGRPVAAVLLFDRKAGVIGICPALPMTPNGYPLIEKKNGRHRVLRANLFCRHYGIYVGRTAAFGTARVDEDGILELELQSLVGVGRMKDESDSFELPSRQSRHTDYAKKQNI